MDLSYYWNSLHNLIYRVGPEKKKSFTKLTNTGKLWSQVPPKNLSKDFKTFASSLKD